MRITQTNQNLIELRLCFGGDRGYSGVAGMIISSIAVILAGLPLPATEGQLSVPTRLTNGNLSFSYAGLSGHYYVAEWAGNLNPPVTWTPLKTNNADLNGVVIFTDTPTVSQKFYRVRSDSFVPPLVYSIESTGTNCAAPPLPGLGSLPLVQPLPDPFMWADWSGRSTDFEDWKCRRAQIQAQIEHYEIGPKPIVPPENVTAGYANGVLTVVVTRTNGRTLTLTSQIAVPSSGSGPFPAIIGMALAPGGGTGSLPSDIFSNCLQITYLHNQVTTYAAGQQLSHTNDPYYLMYPEYNDSNSGQYSAWSWGVSRVIDGLYRAHDQAAAPLNIDLKRIAVTGCSYAGKMALFAGALDERIALTIAQESGGGGATSWRYSHTEPSGSVESLENTDHSWFMDPMFQFGGENVYYLPEDHHMLNSLCLPRALLVTGNTDYTWLSNPSCYVNSRACQQIYKTFGIEDRFGFFIDGGHGHCSFPAAQRPMLQAFVDKFLYGKTNVATANFTNHPASFDSIDYARWYQWWGTTNPVFPISTNADYTLTFEPECATIGTNWQILTDTNASNGKYVTVTPGVQSLSAGPTNAAGWIAIPFTLTNSGNFVVFGRLNCPTADDDSFWIKMDGGSWVMLNGLGTTGWQWWRLNSYALTAGAHTLYMGYREDGAKLDKISMSTYPFAPPGMGQPAENICP